MAYETTAAKKPVNLSVNSDLLRQAKELKVNVSQVLEVALASQVKRLREAQWLEDNKAAIEAYNQHVEENGLPFEAVRQRLWKGLGKPDTPWAKTISMCCLTMRWQPTFPLCWTSKAGCSRPWARVWWRQ